MANIPSLFVCICAQPLAVPVAKVLLTSLETELGRENKDKKDEKITKMKTS